MLNGKCLILLGLIVLVSKLSSGYDNVGKTNVLMRCQENSISTSMLFMFNSFN